MIQKPMSLDDPPLDEVEETIHALMRLDELLNHTACAETNRSEISMEGVLSRVATACSSPDVSYQEIVSDAAYNAKEVFEEFDGIHESQQLPSHPTKEPAVMCEEFGSAKKRLEKARYCRNCPGICERDRNGRCTRCKKRNSDLDDGERPAKIHPADQQACMYVYGAAGRGWSCNGKYTAIGVHNGRPLFKTLPTGAIMYWNQLWKLNCEHSTAGWLYEAPDSSGMDPPTGQWRRFGYPAGDTSLPPCVRVEQAFPGRLEESESSHKSAPEESESSHNSAPPHVLYMAAEKCNQRPPYTLVIPSYGRPERLLSTTLAFLRRQEIPQNRIQVWLAPGKAPGQKHTEMERYSQALAKDWSGITLRTGVKGIMEQRWHISLQFPEGAHIVSLDDDIEDVYCKRTRGNVQKAIGFMPLGGLEALIHHAKDLMEKEHAYIWGLNASPNIWYMNEDRISRRNGILNANFYGYLNRHDESIRSVFSSAAEDIERSCRYFNKDGLQLRYRMYSAKTVYKATGGLALLYPDISDRKAAEEDAIERIATAFPSLLKKGLRGDRHKGVAMNCRFRPIGLSPLNSAGQPKLDSIQDQEIKTNMAGEGAQEIDEHALCGHSTKLRKSKACVQGHVLVATPSTSQIPLQSVNDVIVAGGTQNSAQSSATSWKPHGGSTRSAQAVPKRRRINIKGTEPSPLQSSLAETAPETHRVSRSCRTRKAWKRNILTPLRKGRNTSPLAETAPETHRVSRSCRTRKAWKRNILTPLRNGRNTKKGTSSPADMRTKTHKNRIPFSKRVFCLPSWRSSVYPKARAALKEAGVLGRGTGVGSFQKLCAEYAKANDLYHPRYPKVTLFEGMPRPRSTVPGITWQRYFHGWAWAVNLYPPKRQKRVFGGYFPPADVDSNHIEVAFRNAVACLVDLQHKFGLPKTPHGQWYFGEAIWKAHPSHQMNSLHGLEYCSKCGFYSDPSASSRKCSCMLVRECTRRPTERGQANLDALLRGHKPNTFRKPWPCESMAPDP